MKLLNKFIYSLFFTLIVSSLIFARVDVRKKMKLNKSFHYYKIMGDKNRILNQLAKAVKFYEYALVINPKCAMCYYQLGKIKYQKKLYTDAISELKRALSPDMVFKYAYDRIKTYYLLATIYFDTKNENQAFKVLHELVKEHENYEKRIYEAKLVNPSHYAPAYLLIGIYYRNNSHLDKDKLKYFFKSMQLNFKKDFCNYFIYEYYKSIKRHDLAFKYLNQAMTINPNIQIDLQKATWIKTYQLFKEIDNN